jgi:hypothetical protein
MIATVDIALSKMHSYPRKSSSTNNITNNITNNSKCVKSPRPSLMKLWPWVMLP